MLNARVVELGEVSTHDIHRPHIGHHVVKAQHQCVVLGSQAKQQDAQRRSLHKIDRGPRKLVDRSFLRLVSLEARQVREVKVREGIPVIGHDLLGNTIIYFEPGAQRLVPQNQLPDRVFKQPGVQGTVQREGDGDLVAGPMGTEFLYQPHALLPTGQGEAFH